MSLDTSSVLSRHPRDSYLCSNGGLYLKEALRMMLRCWVCEGGEDQEE